LNSSELLFSRTAKLPRIELERPTTSLGIDTVTQMQIGVVWGEVFMVDGMIERMRHDGGLSDAKVVVTGGLAPVVVPGLRAECIHDPTLTLDGLRMVFELNSDGLP
jgi:type III pantothenate kinase